MASPADDSPPSAWTPAAVAKLVQRIAPWLLLFIGVGVAAWHGDLAALQQFAAEHAPVGADTDAD